MNTGELRSSAVFVYLAKYYSIDRPDEVLYYKIGRTDNLFDRNQSLNPLLQPHKTNIIRAWKTNEQSSMVENKAKIHFVNHRVRGTEEYFNKAIYNEVASFMSGYEEVDNLDVILTTDTTVDPDCVKLYELASNFDEFKRYVEKRYNQGFSLSKESQGVYRLLSGKKVIMRALGINFKPDTGKKPNNLTQITDSILVNKGESVKNWRIHGDDDERHSKVVNSEEALLFVYNCADSRWVALTTKELLALVPYEKWDDESLGDKSCVKYSHKCAISMHKNHLQVGPMSAANNAFNFKLKLEPLLKREFDFVNNRRIDLSSIVIV